LSSPVLLWAGLGCQVPCWELQEGRLEEGVDGRRGEWGPEKLWAQGQAVAVSAVLHWQARSRPLGTLPSSEMGPAIPPIPPGCRLSPGGWYLLSVHLGFSRIGLSGRVSQGLLFLGCLLSWLIPMLPVSLLTLSGSAQSRALGPVSRLTQGAQKCCSSSLWLGPQRWSRPCGEVHAARWVGSAH
jgi:hypothetical protein